jgi:uncharacterized protein (DUF885 family)
VEPAQLTSYEVGGLEIFSLREEAKRRLGAAFDLKEFHEEVLRDGAIPLVVLRANIREWVKRETSSGKSGHAGMPGAG